MVTDPLYPPDNLSPMQILPLFNKYSIIHFNKTDARIANNGISTELQLLRCRVNFHALKFTPQIEGLGNKLVHKLQAKGSFVAVHLRYEMDMLAFSGCNHGLSPEEAEELKKMRFVANPGLPCFVTYVLDMAC
jgi:rhamnogalacturonan I rhamnosyltransferase